MTDADAESLAIDTDIDKQPSFINTESEFDAEERKGEELEIPGATRRYKTEVPIIEDYDRRAKSF